MASTLRIPITEQDHLAGDLTAKIHLIEYGDYQCPHCGNAYSILKQIQQELGSSLLFVFRNFPLTEVHPFAMQAAIAAEAANLQNRFWEMHDIIYENQSKLSKGGLFNLAKKINLDMDRYKTDIDDENLRTKVEKDFEGGMRSGVNFTPSFFIDGKKFEGGAEDLHQSLKQYSL
ncbi:MAG: thioredoxin domain-containing protein [Ferruginibacter sp.]